MIRPRRDHDVDGWPLVVPKPLGMIVQLTSDAPAASGVLWLPDPSRPSGWAEWIVTAPEPARRPIGFRDPREG